MEKSQNLSCGLLVGVEVEEEVAFGGQIHDIAALGQRGCNLSGGLQSSQLNETWIGARQFFHSVLEILKTIFWDWCKKC